VDLDPSQPPVGKLCTDLFQSIVLYRWFGFGTKGCRSLTAVKVSVSRYDGGPGVGFPQVQGQTLLKRWAATPSLEIAVNLVGAQTQRSDTSVKSPEAAAGLYYSVQSGPLLGLVRCCSVRFGSGRLLSARATLRRRYFLEVSQHHKTIYKQNKHKRCMVNRSCAVATGQGCGSRGAPPRRPQQVGVLSCGAIYLVGESIGERSNQHTQRPTSHGHHPPRCGVFDFLHLARHPFKHAFAGTGVTKRGLGGHGGKPRVVCARLLRRSLVCTPLFAPCSGGPPSTCALRSGRDQQFVHMIECGVFDFLHDTAPSFQARLWRGVAKRGRPRPGAGGQATRGVCKDSVIVVCTSLCRSQRAVEALPLLRGLLSPQSAIRPHPHTPASTCFLHNAHDPP
jgi:hypothetical protein